MKRLSDAVLGKLRETVEGKHRSRAYVWPVLSGADCLLGANGNHVVLVFKHTGNPSLCSGNIIDSGQMKYATDGLLLTSANKELVRRTIQQRLMLSSKDLVILLENTHPAPGDLQNLEFRGLDVDMELRRAMAQHELALGLIPMKIFLSHKGVDKELVREYKKTLQLIGFSPWLDEDAMPAGTSLERGILKGFEESCAAVFFITPNFVDEKYLATEVDYALSKEREG